MDRQGTCEIPLAPTGATAGESGTPAHKYVPGLESDLPANQERLGEHEHGKERVDPVTEENKGAEMRGREVVAPS
jgi:hypothetical protein